MSLSPNRANFTTAWAPAKVNLYLHVGPPGPGGLHPVDSLVMFADTRAADIAKGVAEVQAAQERQGERLGPAALGLIASLGLPTVTVFRRLKVAYVSTGDEILSLGEGPRALHLVGAEGAHGATGTVTKRRSGPSKPRL